MDKPRKVNFLMIVIGIAIILIIITMIIVLALGYRYIVYENGRFIGIVESSIPIDGTIKYSDGTTAKLIGGNTIEYSNGDVYEGNVKYLLRHGKGKLTFSNSTNIYIGDFYNNMFEGEGVLSYENGDVYEGSFQKNKKSGNGKYTFADGSTYEGEYKDDMRDGSGLYRSIDGLIYDGEYEKDEQHGYGTQTYINGDVYQGDFKHNIRTGEGVYAWDNGDKYTGSFVNGLLDTRTINEEGEFIVDVSGNYVHKKSAIYTKADETEYIGYFEAGEYITDNAKASEDTDDDASKNNEQ